MRALPEIQHKRLCSFDGTEIAYQISGDGPVVVLANGLGGPYQSFSPIYEALGHAYKIVCWDYRGLYRSACPKDRRTYAIPYHCQDLAILLEQEHIERAVFIGWSMGVQVNFEFFRNYRRYMAGIIAINGTYGFPFHTALDLRISRHVIPLGLRWIHSNSSLAGRLLHQAVDWRRFLPTLQRFGLLATNVDTRAFQTIASEFRYLDLKAYSQLMHCLGAHSARDILPHIDIPTLIIAGDRDFLTPLSTASTLNREIRGSRLVVIQNGTHFTPLEFPTIVQDEIMRFLAGIPGWSTWRSAPTPETLDFGRRTIGRAPPGGHRRQDESSNG